MHCIVRGVIMESIKIQAIAPEFYTNLGKLKNWQTTKLTKGKAVKAHSHKFNAMYFTKGVAELYSKGKKFSLPEYASVFIPKGEEHAWTGVLDNKPLAEIGHFHEGHGIHKIVPEY